MIFLDQILEQFEDENIDGKERESRFDWVDEKQVFVLETDWYIILLIKMLNRGSKSSLKLNSYKVDTGALQESLKQLNDMKEQLQTTISFYKSHEQQLARENQRLKLQKSVSVKADHSKCLQKYVRVQKQLKDQKRQMGRYRQMYQKQKKSSSQLSVQMSKIKLKYQKQERKAGQLIENYKQRISSLEFQLNEFKNSYRSQKYEKQKVQLNKKKSSSNYESESYVSDYEDKKVNPNYSKLKENRDLVESPARNSNQYQYNLATNNSVNEISSKNPSEGINFSYTASYLPNEEDEEVFLSAIRKLYHEMKDLGISGRKILVLPQFKKMSQTKNPSRKDLANFFRSPPIEEKNEHNIEKSLNYLENLVKNKYGTLSGQFITEIVIKKIEEFENLEQLDTEDLQISGMTPSMSNSGIGSSFVRKEIPSKKSIGNEGKFYNSYGRPSVLDYLKIQSSHYLAN